MKKQKNISRILKIAVIAFLVVIIFPTANVKADGAIEIEKNHFKKAVILSGYDELDGEVFFLKGVQGRILKVKSSNKSVAAVKKYENSFFVKPKKTGTTKITITALNGNKKIKWSGNIQVVKFENPFQTLKINNKSCKSKLKASYNSICVKTKKPINKLSYKLKPGWKVNYSYVMEWGYDPNGKLKNGQKYTLNSGEALHIFMEVKNKKRGLSIGTILTIQR